jgi:CRP-like cAMP-binding protein
VNGLDLKAFELLGELSDEEREILAELIEEEPLAEGRVLFEEGVEGDGLVLLLDGEIAIESRGHGCVARVGPGAVLGGFALVNPGRREATALAASTCNVAWLDRASFRRLVDDAPRAACKLMEALLRDAAADLREGLPALRQALPSAPNDGPQ